MTRSGQLGPEEVLELFRAYRRTEARHLRNRLIEQCISSDSTSTTASGLVVEHRLARQVSMSPQDRASGLVVARPLRFVLCPQDTKETSARIGTCAITGGDSLRGTTPWGLHH